MTPLPPEVRELFDGANTAHVATLMRDGAPHCVPMWIGVEGDDAARPHSMAQVRGRVGEILEGDPAWEIIDRIAHKYIGAPYPLRTDRVLYLVDAERAWAQAF